MLQVVLVSISSLQIISLINELWPLSKHTSVLSNSSQQGLCYFQCLKMQAVIKISIFFSLNQYGINFGMLSISLFHLLGRNLCLY